MQYPGWTLFTRQHPSADRFEVRCSKMGIGVRMFVLVWGLMLWGYGLGSEFVVLGLGLRSSGVQSVDSRVALH